MSDNSLTDAAPIEVAGYRIEPSILRVVGHGRETRMEAKAMQVLLYLAEHAGRAVSRRELEEQLWPGRVVTEDSVTNAIAKVRRALADDAHEPRVIETVPKSGYRLIAEVTVLDVPESQGGAPSVDPGPADGRRHPVPVILGAIGVLALMIASWSILEPGGGPADRSGVPSDKTIVGVVPFENLGAAPEYDYLANGVTADLITDLSKLRGLVVTRPGALLPVREGGGRPEAIPAVLEADYLIVGSVQRQGSMLRINVQLYEPRGRRAIWGERYSGPVAEVFDLQDELTAAVVKVLEVEIGPSERASLAIRPTASVAAYDEYLRGFEEHGRRTAADNASARGHFEEAIALDPTFSRAYAGLGLTYSREAIDGWTPTPARSLELAADYAGKAAAMDPLLPQVHFVTGQVELFRRRHERAIEAAERAIEADPSYADAYALLAWTLSYAGRPRKALSALETAMRLSPRPPASYLEIRGEIQFLQGRYEDSIATFRRVLDVNPGYVRARIWNAAALARSGRGEQARWEAVELLVASPDLSLARLGFAFPFKDPRALDSVLDALRTAGVPE